MRLLFVIETKEKVNKIILLTEFCCTHYRTCPA